MSKPKILYATTNNHKIRLFDISWKQLGLDKKFELLTLQDLPEINIGHVEENSGTFTGDALLKAKTYAKAYNLPTISQDRGFIFDALNWPGTDSKKVFILDDEHVFKKGEWAATQHLYFERAKEILKKIEGLDRSMTWIQGLAIALPSGESFSEEHKTKGRASIEPIESVSGVGGLADWFFIPNGVGHTISEFKTASEADEYEALVLYPITSGVVKFLEGNLK